MKQFVDSRVTPGYDNNSDYSEQLILLLPQSPKFGGV